MLQTHPDNEVIPQAEQARLALHHEKVAELLKHIPEYTLEELAKLPPEQINTFMRALRIRVDSLSSQFSQAWLAQHAIAFMAQAKVLLDYYYSSPEIRTAAAAMHLDPDGNQYEMLSEMWRDIGDYCMKLAVMTGNTVLLDMAAQSYEKATKLAPADTSASILGRFKQQLVAVEAGEPVNLDVLLADWRQLVALSTQAGGHDRAAKVSWDMSEAAMMLGHKDLAKEAKQVCRQHAMYLPGGYVRYAARRLVSHITASTRQITYNGSGAELQLSPATLRE